MQINIRRIGLKIIVAVLAACVICTSLLTVATVFGDDADIAAIDENIKKIVTWAFAGSENEGGTYVISDVFKSAGESASDWYAFSLAENNVVKTDGDAYLSALGAAVDNMYKNVSGGGKYKLTDWYRILIVNAALGGDPHDIGGHDLVNDYIADFRNFELLDEQGITAAIWGIIAAEKNGILETACDFVQFCKGMILSYRMSNGAFSLNGKAPDVDITAMALTALAPISESYPDLPEVISSALGYLSDVQMADGGFMSFGTPNSESISQVIIALCTLNIDISDDARFVKNGRNCLNALLKYKTEAGGFAHTIGNDGSAAPNSIAGYQALCAFDALRYYKSGDGSIYSYRKKAQDNTSDATMTPGNPQPGSTPAPEEKQDEPGLPSDVTAKTDIKTAIIIAIAGIAAILIIVIIVRFLIKRRSQQVSPKTMLIDIGVISAAAAVLIAITGSLSIESREEHFSGNDAQGKVTGTIEFKIDCSEVREDGQILYYKGKLYEGETVYDVLLRLTKENRIAIDTQGTQNGIIGGIYVKGIDYLYEFDHGNESGWVFYVNDMMPNVSCSSCTLKDGDSVLWKYVCEYEGGVS